MGKTIKKSKKACALINLLKFYWIKDFILIFKKWVYNIKRGKHKYLHHWQNVKHGLLFFHFDKLKH
jgi:hypothetical protein